MERRSLDGAPEPSRFDVAVRAMCDGDYPEAEPSLLFRQHAASTGSVIGVPVGTDSIWLTDVEGTVVALGPPDTELSWAGADPQELRAHAHTTAGCFCGPRALTWRALVDGFSVGQMGRAMNASRAELNAARPRPSFDLRGRTGHVTLLRQFAVPTPLMHVDCTGGSAAGTVLLARLFNEQADWPQEASSPSDNFTATFALPDACHELRACAVMPDESPGGCGSNRPERCLSISLLRARAAAVEAATTRVERLRVSECLEPIGRRGASFRLQACSPCAASADGYTTFARSADGEILGWGIDKSITLAGGARGVQLRQACAHVLYAATVNLTMAESPSIRGGGPAPSASIATGAGPIEAQLTALRLSRAELLPAAAPGAAHPLETASRWHSAPPRVRSTRPVAPSPTSLVHAVAVYAGAALLAALVIVGVAAAVSAACQRATLPRRWARVASEAIGSRREGAHERATTPAGGAMRSGGLRELDHVVPSSSPEETPLVVGEQAADEA